MSIKDLVITDQNVQSVYVQSQPDRLTGTAQQNKAVFDALPQLIIQRFNLLLEALAGTGAAGEIPVGPIEGVTAENVQQALSAIQQNLTAYIDKIKSAVGASEVGVSPISGLEASNVQAALQALRTIQSAINQNVQTIMSEKGAEKVGVTAISGMTAQNVQQALAELRKAIDNIVSGIIPGGSITPDMIAGPIPPEKGGTGATTAQAALAKLGAGVRPSLVDNGIFVGENLPINQDGKTSWTAYQRTVDRWFKEQSGTCSLDVDGFHVSASACVTQTIPDYSFLLGKAITVSILLSDGRYASVTGMCPTASGTDFNILASIEKLRYGIQIFTEYSYYQIGRIDNLENDADVIVVGVKTEEGPNQTLYYVGDDGKGHLLPQNDADYATQLLKCQQYYWDYGPESGGALIVLACTIAGNGKEFNFLIPTSTKMYTPIHFAFESLTVSDLEGNYYAFSKDDFSVMSINSGSSGVAVRFRVTANTGLADGFGVFFGSGLFLEGGA